MFYFSQEVQANQASLTKTGIGSIPFLNRWNDSGHQKSQHQGYLVPSFFSSPQFLGVTPESSQQLQMELSFYQPFVGVTLTQQDVVKLPPVFSQSVEAQKISKGHDTSEQTSTTSFVIERPAHVAPQFKKFVGRHRRRRSIKKPMMTGKLCVWCKTSKTPEWRFGPNRVTLCNACGLQYRNQQRAEKESKIKNAITNLLNPTE